MWTVLGQDRTIVALASALAGEKLAHSLLFVGPSGVGKTTLAIELAKALNCIGEDVPCDTCFHCRQIDAASHPDVLLTERVDGKDSIAITQVRELREATSLKPFQGRRKVYIIAGAEALTAQAADALLKTLEEPQPDVTMILTAADVSALPATIISRCRVYPLQPVATGVINDALQKRGLSGDDAERSARLAKGNIGWAFHAVDQPKLVIQQEEALRALSAVFAMDLEARLQLAETLTAEKRDRDGVRRTLETLTALARDLMLMSQGLSPQIVAGKEAAQLKVHAQRYTVRQLSGVFERLQLAMTRIDSNVDARVALEALLVGLP